jgi:polyhydroxyalkanoate synthesis regulator phasin
MATIIDKLLVQIGLDAKGLNKGLDSTVKRLKDAEKQIDKNTKKNKKNYDELSEKSQDYADDLKEENKQYGILSRSLMGMAKGFVAVATARKVLAGVEDLGNTEKMSKFLGMSSTTVGTLEKLSDNIGDKSHGILSNIADMQNAITSFQVEGKGGELFKYMSMIGVSPVDAQGQRKDTVTFLRDLRKGLMGIEDPMKRAYMARQMGMGEGLSFLLSKDDAEFERSISEAEKNAQSVAKASKDAQSLREKAETSISKLKGSALDLYEGKSPQVMETVKESFKDAKSKAQHVMDVLMNKGGLSREESASFVGGFMGESGLKPSAKNPGKDHATGIAQWLGVRKKRFQENYGKPLESATLDEQLQYVLDELGTTEKRSLKNLRQSNAGKTSEQQVLSGVDLLEGSKGYERGDSTPQLMARKKQYAMEAYTDSLRRRPSEISSQSPAANQNSGITINGDITVNTQATDAKGLARDLSQDLGRKSALSEGNMH